MSIKAAEAIGQFESGGNYNAIGPATSKGNKAYGKYQVMDFNIPNWSKEATGRASTTEEFKSNPSLQDKVARFKINQYWDKYKNVADVASVWFSGRPVKAAGNAADVIGTTVPQYVKNVEAIYNRTENPLLQNFNTKVDKSRQLNLTDTQILDKLGAKDPEVRDKIEKSRTQLGLNDRDLLNKLSVKFSGSMPTVASVPLRGGLGEIRGEVKEEPKKNFFQRIFGKEGRIEERGENVADILQESGKQSTLSTGFQVFAQNLGLMKDVAFEGVVSAFRGVSNITPDFIEKPLVDAVKQSAIETFETFKNSPEGQQAFQKLGEGLESYKLWAKDHPEAHRNLVAAGETVDFALQGLGVGKVKKILKEPVKQGIETGVKTVQKVAKETVKAGEKVAKTTENAFDTAVRSLSTAKEKVGVLGGAVKEAGLGLKSKATGLPERLEINIKVKQEARKAFNELPPVEKKAVTQGILVRDANLINTSSDGNKIVMREILDSAKKFESNRLSSARPSAVLGTEFRKRLTGLKDEVSKAGKAMGEMVKDIPKTSVTGVKESVLKRMKEVLGLSELKLVNGKLNFTDTTLAGSLTASDRRIIQSVFDDLANKNAFQLHQLRRELFEDLGGRKLSGLKLTETQEKGVNAIRKGIADILEGVSPKYKATNQSYTQLAEMQKNIKKMFGDVAEGGEDIFDAKSSILLRRLTSNTKSGQDIASLIKEVEDLLKVKGINFDTDIGALQEFVNIINRYYDVAGDTSLLGILRTKDIPLKPSSAIAKVLEGVIDAGSITDDTAKQAIDDLLKLSK